METLRKGLEDMSSLNGLKIEWDYESENPLGKRKFVRILKKDLSSLFDVDKVLVKIHGSDVDATGSLQDISENGCAVLLYNQLAEGMQVRIGFLLGRRKVLTRATVRNITHLDGKFRVGMEFVGLGKSDAAFLLGLVPSTILRY